MRNKKLLSCLIKHHETLAVAVFSFFLLFGLGFHIMLYFPLHQSPDIQTYLAMAQWDFDQSEIRKYRIIIPIIAGLINTLFHPLFEIMAPWTFQGDFSLCMSFLLINTGFMSLSAVFIYKISKIYLDNKMVCGIALLAFLSNRWTLETSGLPLVDSLYLLSIVLGIYGMLSKKWPLILCSILIGPWAKEAYIFMIPLLIFYGYPSRLKLAWSLLLSGCLVFSFRFLMDHYSAHHWSSSLLKDLDSFQTIPLAFKRLFSFHGLYELFSAIGLWFVFPLSALLFHTKEFTSKILQHGRAIFIAYLPFVLLQALLSADLGRMFYLAIPQVIIAVAVALDIWRKKLDCLTGMG
ncbi:MAG: hypothetical protein IPM92_09260 [Saprospiraceae bacterium]|nr:hypothetical protein [Saprospiraceae bacterium]